MPTGTGYNANFLPWHQFYRMISDRFNAHSKYEIVGQFHNFKQVGFVLDYVDRFEEMVTMMKRTNPTLSDQYYISSFISGLKDNIQYHLQCHQPTSLSQAYLFAKRLEKASPSVGNLLLSRIQLLPQSNGLKTRKHKIKILLN